MNTFGNIFKLTTFGESHGRAIGGVIDGCPAGLTLDLNAIQERLALRSPQYAEGSTTRIEKDKVEFLSGIFKGKTIGTPIAFIIKNENIISNDYSDLEHIYRPGHADYTYQMRYGIRDYRGGGRASARETAVRVVAGAIAEQWLSLKGVKITAYVDQIGSVKLPSNYVYQDIEKSPLRCPDATTEQQWMSIIENVTKSGDTIGGSVKCIIAGMPAGIGEPIFDKIQSQLASAMMSIPAAKGFEYGLGMQAPSVKGSESNDEMTMQNGKIIFKSNNAGGLLGGITTGEDIYFRVAFKPVSSIRITQKTVNDTGENIEFQIKGRHDVCIAPRAAAIVRAMAAIVMTDQILLRKNNNYR